MSSTTDATSATKQGESGVLTSAPQKRGGGPVVFMRTIWRLHVMALVFLWAGIVFNIRALFGKLSPKFVGDFSQRSGRRILRWTGMDVTFEGQTELDGCLLIANHRSYTDIPAMLAAAPVIFLAKYEVRKMFLIGWAARLAGTVFVDRKDKESRANARLELKQRLDEGRSVLVFAEGTTTGKGEMLPLKPGMFYTAAELGLPVIPAAIEYEDPEDAWIGDDGFMSHFFRRFGQPRMGIKVVFGPTLRGTDAMLLKAQTTDWISGQLGTDSPVDPKKPVEDKKPEAQG